MKLVSEHLGEVLLAVLGASLVVAVIILFRSEAYGFVDSVIDKFQSISTSFLGGV